MVNFTSKSHTHDLCKPHMHICVYIILIVLYVYIYINYTVSCLVYKPAPLHHLQGVCHILNKISNSHSILVYQVWPHAD